MLLVLGEVLSCLLACNYRVHVWALADGGPCARCTLSDHSSCHTWSRLLGTSSPRLDTTLDATEAGRPQTLGSCPREAPCHGGAASFHGARTESWAGTRLLCGWGAGGRGEGCRAGFGNQNKGLTAVTEPLMCGKGLTFLNPHSSPTEGQTLRCLRYVC